VNQPSGARPTLPDPNDPDVARVIRQLSDMVKYLLSEVVKLKEAQSTLRGTVEKHDQVING
jgi:hypothetical protein